MASGRLTVLEQLDPFVDMHVLLDIKRKVEFQPSRVKHQPVGAKIRILYAQVSIIVFHTGSNVFSSVGSRYSYMKYR